MNKQEIGIKLKIIRKQQHIKLYQAAERMGISQAYLCQIELGNRYPTINVLLQILAFYGYTLEITVI